MLIKKPKHIQIQSLALLTQRPSISNNDNQMNNNDIDAKINEILREPTPKDIRKRLKEEKLKDAKLNFCSVKEVLI